MKRDFIGKTIFLVAFVAILVVSVYGFSGKMTEERHDAQNKTSETTTENKTEEEKTETIAQTTTEEEKENRELPKSTDKLGCFTFDDGPGGKYTNKLMDNLDKYDARVTFFVVGSRVNSYKSTLKRAYDQGNEIGSHTYSHSNLTKLNDAELKKEINDTNNLIENVTGAKPTLIRPPYGSTNDKVKKTSGMYNILWSIDTLDWKHRDKNKVADAITKNAFDGAIVLMHDIYETSVDGALIAMDKLSKEGYAFVTVDEMRELRGAEWDISKNYTSFKK